MILSISDVKIKSKTLQNLKIISVYLAVTLVCIAVNKIYAIFGHGVSSEAMTWMFLYPLIGGILFFLMKEIMIPRINQDLGVRAFSNIYNAGIATLTVGSFLKGMMDIAGTSSPYVVFYFEIGWLCIVCSLISLIICKLIHKDSKGYKIT